MRALIRRFGASGVWACPETTAARKLVALRLYADARYSRPGAFRQSDHPLAEIKVVAFLARKPEGAERA